MSERIGMVRVSRPDGSPDPIVEEEVRRLIEVSYAKAREILISNRAGLDALTNALLDRETLDGDEVRRVVSQASSVDTAAA